MTAEEWACLFTNPGAIDHPLDGSDLVDIIQAAMDKAIAEFKSDCDCRIAELQDKIAELEDKRSE